MLNKIRGFYSTDNTGITDLLRAISTPLDHIYSHEGDKIRRMDHGEHPNPSSEQHLYQPSLPFDRSSSWKRAFGVCHCIEHHHVLDSGPNMAQYYDTHILGDPETDAIRGMWGFNHIQQSLLPPDTPIWSNPINFHAGVVALMLPFTTGICYSTNGLILGFCSGLEHRGLFDVSRLWLLYSMVGKASDRIVASRIIRRGTEHVPAHANLCHGRWNT